MAQFKITNDVSGILNGTDGEAFLLAWTTTPWTLPSNTALTVGKNIDYVLVRTFNQYTFKPVQVILAKALLNYQFGGKFENAESDDAFSSYTMDSKKIPYKVLKEFKGSELVGTEYEQLLPCLLYTSPSPRD